MTYSNNFNENTRVKIPSLLTLVRLGFEYISLNDKNTKSKQTPLIGKDQFFPFCRNKNRIESFPFGGQ